MATYARSLYSFGTMLLTGLCLMAVMSFVKPPTTADPPTGTSLYAVAHQISAAIHHIDFRADVRNTLREGCRKCGKQANAEYVRDNQIGQSWRTAADITGPPQAIPWRV